VQAFFSEICTVTSVNLLTDRETGNSRGMAFVKLAS